MRICRRRSWPALSRALLRLEDHTTEGGAGYLGPTMKATKALADEQGIDSPEVTAKFDRLLMVARLDGLLLAAVVVIMAVKPGV